MENFWTINLGTIIALVSLYITLYFTFRTKINLITSFQNSPNDRSVKVNLEITNLSNQAKIVNDLILYKDDKVVKDNGYIYSEVEKAITKEDKLKDEEIKKARLKRNKEKVDKKIEDDNKDLYNRLYKHWGLSYQEFLDEMKKENAKNMKTMKKRFPSFDRIMKLKNETSNPFDNALNPSNLMDDYDLNLRSIKYRKKYSSNNFKNTTLLTKEKKFTFSYWVNYNEIPDKVKIVSNNRISLFSHSKIFKIVQK